MVNLFLTFEVEVLSRLQRWESVQAAVEVRREVLIPEINMMKYVRDFQVAAKLECVNATTLESIANLLWTDEACPTDVLYNALDVDKVMLRASLDSKHMSIDKFSRWLRALCTILLGRNKQQDRANALSFIEQAVEVIKENENESGDQVRLDFGDVRPGREWNL
ncbi:hypothetical protein FRC10_001993 [Ceratobasidium sp. 414]|nr:hypothetical protein FRC10_001993 [Ceratobasidium sp. 414]